VLKLSFPLESCLPRLPSDWVGLPSNGLGLPSNGLGLLTPADPKQGAGMELAGRAGAGDSEKGVEARLEGGVNGGPGDLAGGEGTWGCTELADW